MQYTASTVEEYLQQIPEDRKAPIEKLRKIVKKNIPKGFKEVISYGMIGFVIPHSLYAPGYHCDPKLPLPFMNIASQKNFIAVYHMGLYADPKLMDWFTKAYAILVAGKLDMGKSCMRFKKPEQIPFDLIGELAGKMSVDEWIGMYEKLYKRLSK